MPSLDIIYSYMISTQTKSSTKKTIISASKNTNLFFFSHSNCYDMSEFGYSGRGSDSWTWDPVVATGPRTSVSSINQVHATLSGSPELTSVSSINQVHATLSGSPELSSDIVSSSSKPGQKSGSGSKPWGFNDPEIKRKKRIAKYKAYAVEGKVKASVKKGVRWFKNKCSLIVHGC